MNLKKLLLLDLFLVLVSPIIASIDVVIDESNGIHYANENWKYFVDVGYSYQDSYTHGIDVYTTMKDSVSNEEVFWDSSYESVNGVGRVVFEFTVNVYGNALFNIKATVEDDEFDYVIKQYNGVSVSGIPEIEVSDIAASTLQGYTSTRISWKTQNIGDGVDENTWLKLAVYNDAENSWYWNKDLLVSEYLTPGTTVNMHDTNASGLKGGWTWIAIWSYKNNDWIASEWVYVFPKLTLSASTIKTGWTLMPGKNAYKTVTATVKPERMAGDVWWSSSNTGRATLWTIGQSTVGDTKQYQFAIVGESATPVSSPTGDTNLSGSVSGTTLVSSKIIVSQPKTRHHTIGGSQFDNNTWPGVSSTTVQTLFYAIVEIEIRDQFNTTLTDVFNGTFVVEERFRNIVETQPTLTPDREPIDTPDGILANGRIDDRTQFGYTWELPVGFWLNAQQAQAWDQGILPLQVNGGPIGYNLFELLGGQSAEGDMDLWAHGHSLSPTLKRTMIATQNNHVPVVPYTVTDQ